VSSGSTQWPLLIVSSGGSCQSLSLVTPVAPVDCPLQWLLSIVVVSSRGSTLHDQQWLLSIVSSGSCAVDRLQWLLCCQSSSPVAPVDRLQWLLLIVVSSPGSGSCRSSRPVAPVDHVDHHLVQWLHQWLLSIVSSPPVAPVDRLISSGSCQSSRLQWLLLIVSSPVAPVDRLVSSGSCQSSRLQWLLSIVSSSGSCQSSPRPVAPVAPVDRLVSSGSC